MTTSQVVLVIAFIVVVAVIVIVRRATPRAAPEPVASDASDRMAQVPQRILVCYLVVIGFLLVYLIAKLYTVDFPETPFVIEVPAQGSVPVALARSEAVATDAKTPSAPSGPEIFHVFPQSTLGTAPAVQLAVYGRNFDSLGSTVRINRQVRGRKFGYPDLLVVDAAPIDLIGVGTLVVEVANPDGRISNAMTLSVVRPQMELSLFRQEFPITREVQLILLVLCAGALGSYVHSVKSLADYIGNDTLTRTWFWWYVTRPFLGMALAFIFYAVLRGGFLTGTPADVRVVNPFGAMAVAALVGMFADRAAQKLAEIFDALFKGEDLRRDRLAAPTITKLEPGSVETGSPNPPLLRIVGERLGKAASVRIGGQERPVETTSEKEVTVQLQPGDVSTSRDIGVSVTTADGSAASPAPLHVSDLQITTSSPLPARVVGSPYGHAMAATGGKQPYTWVPAGAPAWLTLDAVTGNLTGTPTGAGPDEFDVHVTDDAGAVVTKRVVLP